MGGSSSCAACGEHECETVFTGNKGDVSYITIENNYEAFKKIHEKYKLTGDIYTINLATRNGFDGEHLFISMLAFSPQLFIPVAQETIDTIRKRHGNTMTLMYPQCYGDNGYEEGDRIAYDFTERCCVKSYQNMKEDLSSEPNKLTGNQNNADILRMMKLKYSPVSQLHGESGIVKNLDKIGCSR
jgi:hypothetical protein